MNYNPPEPIPEGAYLVCGECFHYWATEDDLIRDTRNMQVEIGMSHPATVVLPVLFCPFCAHGF